MQVDPHETEEYKALQQQNSTDTVVRKARWVSLKEEFMEAMVTGKPFHWPTISAKYGFAAQSARNKASVHKWHSEIEKRRKARDDLLDKKLVDRSEKALDILNKDFATNEVAIRGRHALMARGLQSKSIGEIGKRDLTKASLSDLLRMVELGIREERFAMGLPEVADAVAATEDISSMEFKPIQEQVGGHKNLQKLGSLLLGELQKANKGKLPKIQDVEAKPTTDRRVFYEDDQESETVSSTEPEDSSLLTSGIEEAQTVPPPKSPKIIINHKSKI